MTCVYGVFSRYNGIGNDVGMKVRFLAADQFAGTPFLYTTPNPPCEKVVLYRATNGVDVNLIFGKPFLYTTLNAI